METNTRISIIDSTDYQENRHRKVVQNTILPDGGIAVFTSVLFGDFSLKCAVINIENAAGFFFVAVNMLKNKINICFIDMFKSLFL
jgi:hypothetical protein